MVRNRVEGPQKINGGGGTIDCVREQCAEEEIGPRRMAVQNCGENCTVGHFVLRIMALWWLI